MRGASGPVTHFVESKTDILEKINKALQDIKNKKHPEGIKNHEKDKNSRINRLNPYSLFNR